MKCKIDSCNGSTESVFGLCVFCYNKFMQSSFGDINKYVEWVNSQKSGGDKAIDNQVGGSHYKDMSIQPMQFFAANKTPFPEANACKYILRHAYKNGKEDLLKAKHCIELMLEIYYGEV